MSVLTSFRIALKALNRNKLRTALTMLGMIVGVAAVIAMIALGNGAQATVEAEVKSAGTNLISVSAGNYTRGGEEVNIASGLGAATTLTKDDADAIATISGVQHRAPGVGDRAWVSATDRKYFTRIQGTDVELPLMYGWAWTHGRFFGREDVTNQAGVAVLGTVASEKLFGSGVDPVGQQIQIRNQPFRVVGVTASTIEDQGETIFVPFATLQTMLGIAYLHTVTVAAEQAGETARIAQDITALLRMRHKLDSHAGTMPQQAGPTRFRSAPPAGVLSQPTLARVPDDFTVRTQAAQAITKGLYTSVAAFALANLPKLDEVTLKEMTSTLSRASTTMTALLGCIAAVSLIVGGIGIMNIMLVSVRERTREIGIRMAVGAHARDVLLQFLVEAVTLSLLGGLLGIAFGFVASGGITRVLEWPTTVSPGAIALAFGIAAAVGVFFGFYPAHKASRLDPIEALRYE